MQDTNHDMMNLTKNLREEMKLARKLSLKRIDQAAAMKKPPPGQIQYPQIEDESSSSSSSILVPIKHYPTLAEVSKLPSSRYFGEVLDEEFYEDDTPQKPAATITTTTTTTTTITSTIPEHAAHGIGQTTASTNGVEIEVFPGVFKLLRGSKETQDAWDCGLCAQAPCMVCDAELAFVWDCEFVICPNCKAVVPVDNTTEPPLGESIPSLQSSLQSSMSSFLSESETAADLPRHGGVGLGIRIR